MVLLGTLLAAIGGFCIGYSFVIQKKSENDKLIDQINDILDQKIDIQLELATTQQIFVETQNALDEMGTKSFQIFIELEDLKASINKEQEAALKVLNKQLKKSVTKKKANIKKVSFSKKVK